MAATVEASWTKLTQLEPLQRSSHSIAVIGKHAYVFGGELLPRQPRDGDIHSLELTGKDAVHTLSASKAPSPRVGTTLTNLNGKLYAFSGRGGEAMAPIDEQGGIWCFDPETTSWTLLQPSDPKASVPEARSYHCATTDGTSKLFIHAGCPAKGRLKDLWAFDIEHRTWTKLPDAPGAERGGTSICHAEGKLWRMGGFDGKTELGGSIDAFDLSKGEWETISFSADGIVGPCARSVSTLLPLKLRGRPSLATVFGEADPSALGHAGAGKMLEDAWLFDINDRRWSKVHAEAGDGAAPAPRGWFAAASDTDTSIVVVGGLGEDNERLDDAWRLTLGE